VCVCACVCVCVCVCVCACVCVCLCVCAVCVSVWVCGWLSTAGTRAHESSAVEGAAFASSCTALHLSFPISCYKTRAAAGLLARLRTGIKGEGKRVIGVRFSPTAWTCAHCSALDFDRSALPTSSISQGSFASCQEAPLNKNTQVISDLQHFGSLHLTSISDLQHFGSLQLTSTDSCTQSVCI